jgi:hypothetical protein
MHPSWNGNRYEWEPLGLNNLLEDLQRNNPQRESVGSMELVSQGCSVIDLLELLATNTHVHTLCLYLTPMSAAGHDMFQWMLETNTTITTGNFHAYIRLDGWGGFQLAAGIRAHPGFRHLNLSCNQLYTTEIECLADALATQENLESLNLRSSLRHADFAATIQVCRSLQMCVRLKSLNLARCVLRHECVEILKPLLQDGQIEYLDVGGCFEQSSVGAVVLGYLNNRIVDLNFNGNNPGADCAEEIRLFLLRNQKVTSLKMCHEDHAILQITILMAARQHPTLVHLQVGAEYSWTEANTPASGLVLESIRHIKYAIENNGVLRSITFDMGVLRSITLRLTDHHAGALTDLYQVIAHTPRLHTIDVEERLHDCQGPGYQAFHRLQKRRWWSILNMFTLGTRRRSVTNLPTCWLWLLQGEPALQIGVKYFLGAKEIGDVFKLTA